jgi:V8-like Glu-specific endopeptidase
MTAVTRWILAAALLACGPRDETGSSRSPIVGGTLDNTDNSVVAIVVYPPGTSSQTVEVCSGTVVSPHVVLTAAHCIDPSIVGPIDHVQIFTGNDFNDPGQFGDANYFLDVAQRSFDPMFTADFSSGHDIAVVVAAATIPLTPLPMNRTALGNGDVGAAVHAVGFGESNGADTTSAGPRRFIDAKVFGVDALHLVLDDVICEGDSGGPSFLTKNGKQVIAGVHSFTNAQACIGTGDDTRVDLYAASFVDPVINQADPGYLSGGCNVGGNVPSRDWLLVLIALTAWICTLRAWPTPQRSSRRR